MKHWVLLPLFLATLAHAQEITNPKNTPADVEAGAKIYRSHCAECHGIKGDGGRGPDLTTGRFHHGSSDQALLNNIMNGIRGTEMPGIYLQSHQVWKVVAFVRSLSANTEPAALTGDATRGEQFFRGAGACSSCHMVNGSGGRLGPDLSAIGGSRAVKHLRASLADPSAEVRNAWWSYKVSAKSGEKITGFRLNEDTWSLQMLDTSGNLRALTKADLAGIDVSRQSTMPSYAHLEEPQTDDLIAYLATLNRR
jgi:cytochrome c oxidase cbb3-type subunit III